MRACAPFAGATDQCNRFTRLCRFAFLLQQRFAVFIHGDESLIVLQFDNVTGLNRISSGYHRAVYRCHDTFVRICRNIYAVMPVGSIESGRDDAVYRSAKDRAGNFGRGEGRRQVVTLGLFVLFLELLFPAASF